MDRASDRSLEGLAGIRVRLLVISYLVHTYIPPYNYIVWVGIVSGGKF